MTSGIRPERFTWNADNEIKVVEPSGPHTAVYSYRWQRDIGRLDAEQRLHLESDIVRIPTPPTTLPYEYVETSGNLIASAVRDVQRGEPDYLEALAQWLEQYDCTLVTRE